MTRRQNLAEFSDGLVWGLISGIVFAITLYLAVGVL